MRHYALLLLILFFASIQASAVTTINYYTWRAQEQVLWEEISNRNLISGVKINVRVVRYQAHESFKPHVTIEMLHDEADLFQWSPGAANLKPLIDNGLIKPNQADVSDINKAALLASMGPDGRYYGVPFALQLQSLLVNRKQINKFGVDGQPGSLDELDRNFAKLKSSGVTPLHMAGSANWLINQVVSEVMMAGLVEEEFAGRLEKGLACFTDRNYTEIFRVMGTWRDKGYFNTGWENEGYAGMNNSVALGNSAMAFDGGWKTGPASNFWEVDADFQFDFWAVPGKVGKVYALGDGTYQVNHTSSRAEAAYKALQFTATQEFATLFAEYVKELPAYGGSISISNPILKRMSSLLADNSYTVSLFTSDRLNKGSPSYNDLVAEAFKKVLTREFSPEEAGRFIQRGLNSWNYVGAQRCDM